MITEYDMTTGEPVASDRTAITDNQHSPIIDRLAAPALLTVAEAVANERPATRPPADVAALPVDKLISWLTRG